MSIDLWYLENLVCPRDYSKLILENNKLCCQKGHHNYPIVNGVPVMLLDDKKQTMKIVDNSIRRSKGESMDLRSPDLYLESLGIGEKEKLLAVSLAGKTKVDPVVSVIIQATCGNLYKGIIGKLESYPIPEMRLEKCQGKRLLDIGCNWGRWSIAAHKLGYEVVGIDPSLGAIMAAKRVNNSFDFNIKYIVADARFLPFAKEYFDVVFSYSVLQHLDKGDVKLCLEEISRTLHIGGHSFIQMPNKIGIRNIYNQMRKSFRKPVDFEVRYWWPRELKSTFNKFIGRTSLEVDGFFGLNIQKNDFVLMPFFHKVVIIASEILRKISKIFLPIVYLADSLYVKSIKNNPGVKEA